MIFLDAKIFGTNKIYNLLLDENADVNDALTRLSKAKGTNLNSCFVMSKRNKCFISKNQSFKKQGISGGDRLIIIRRED